MSTVCFSFEEKKTREIENELFVKKTNPYSLFVTREEIEPIKMSIRFNFTEKNVT